MELHGQHLIGHGTSTGDGPTFHGVDPRDGATLPPAYRDATDAEIDAALQLAATAHPTFENVGRRRRADLLDAIATGIESLGDALLERASRETGLPLTRLQGERARTCAQLRLFAAVVRDGGYLDVRIEHADPERQPIPKPDVRSMRRAIGPVVVFGASNFPLAFSVAGGDTASALAAGCPVVVKAHPAHPGTSEMVGRTVQSAVRSAELPEGVFSMVHGATNRVGETLVRHPETTAVGFTGSLRGGRALFDIAQARPVPIPVFAEMGSTNPIFVLPGALSTRADAIATGLATSVTLGVGQFCTKPGVVVLPGGDTARHLLDVLAARLAEHDDATMLHAGIHAAYESGLDARSALPGVEILHRGRAQAARGARPALLRTSCAAFLADQRLRSELFGPTTLAVVCEDVDGLRAVAAALDGQLTATIHADSGDAADLALAADLAELLAQRAGRVLFGGFPTGVDVNHAMIHGGPYPATTCSASTSVGTAAIERFTRRVCWQDFPEALLPPELRDGPPSRMPSLVDGTRWLPRPASGGTAR
ncbi:MAG: aldehyde dehydrogenase (NADP(+)) [Planctomycetes bacterium]|nr:aldehyde dehydrogenase (NADP(+)) [Planctomycetota bacterium]